ncbi:hypothetical protein HGP17_29335 [Rhizobium sp. P38BS-XIX]|uniref:hypothetical protein n=1 Tax=Rhizobium sp. P38BS-XIX TaxID=2726740 RepID=UPI0014573F0C|nr:hypothetical protein [Rhizobium sp. P38BS-XIX]NLS00953.1 hypothetical protein [Rhizobium sp. P38BS-XIX]
MTHRDLTIAEVLKDPLIRQIMKADRISIAGMANLLKDAAQKQQRTLASRLAPMANVSGRTFRQVDLRG